MATVPTQIRIDEGLKAQSTELFSQLGIDMSSAVNMFLRQCVMKGGLPFNVSVPRYKRELVDAMDEAIKLSADPNAKRYKSFSEALEDLN